MPWPNCTTVLKAVNAAVFLQSSNIQRGCKVGNVSLYKADATYVMQCFTNTRLCHIICFLAVLGEISKELCINTTGIPELLESLNITMCDGVDWLAQGEEGIKRAAGLSWPCLGMLAADARPPGVVQSGLARKGLSDVLQGVSHLDSQVSAGARVDSNTGTRELPQCPLSFPLYHSWRPGMGCKHTGADS